MICLLAVLAALIPGIFPEPCDYGRHYRADYYLNPAKRRLRRKDRRTDFESVINIAAARVAA